MQVDEETKKATGITDEQYINQFPYEACIVMKHHLAETVQKVTFFFFVNGSLIVLEGFTGFFSITKEPGMQ